jgi:hypothetical protein
MELMILEWPREIGGPVQPQHFNAIGRRYTNIKAISGVEPRRAGMARSTILAVLIGIIALAVSLSTTDQKSASKVPPVYTIHTANDTVWVQFGEFKIPALLSTMTSPDSSHLTFAHDLVLSAGKDTLTISPTTETVRVWMTSNRDTVLALFFFVKEESDTAKVALLREYSTYGHAEPPPAIFFEYMSPTDSELAKLRVVYNLDSIAGSGDEISRIENLMHWVHVRLPHNGTVSLPNPDPFTPVNILAVAEKEKRPFHCGILATVLNDVYLSMGFKSRHLGCLPFDKQDSDRHSVTMVWSDSIHQWLLMDPTFDVYFTNTKGTPLSPLQIRTAMAKGDSILVADCINWNGQPRSKVEHYNYMAKNLFCLLCGARWSSATGAKARPVYVYLIPAGYETRTVGTIDSTASEGIISYYTDNADWFFAPPK